MTASLTFVKRLKLAATKAAARAAAAKTEVRAAKAQLKQARKLFKAEKKAAKQARRKVDAAAVSAARRLPRPAATLKLKPAVRKPPAKPVPAERKRATVTSKASPKSRPSKSKRRRATKARIPAAPVMRSAAEVAKSVIERLHAPPPILPPEPIIPSDSSATQGDPGANAPAKPGIEAG